MWWHIALLHVQYIGVVVMVQVAAHIEASQSANSSVLKRSGRGATSRILLPQCARPGRDQNPGSCRVILRLRLGAGSGRTGSSESESKSERIVSQVKVEREDESGLRGVFRRKYSCA
jgi:hypothetical protein